MLYLHLRSMFVTDSTHLFFGLLVVVTCLIVSLLFVKWQSKHLPILGNENTIAPLLKNFSLAQSKKRRLFFILSIICLILALVNPRSAGMQATSTANNTKQIVFALDLSTSMNATDVSRSRLQKAKQFINSCMQNDGNKYGLVVFASNAFLAVPLTIDAAAIKMNLETLETSTLPMQGTNISDALLAAANCFSAKQAYGKIVVLITDGEDHEEGVKEAIKKLTEKEVDVICIGVGTTEGARILLADGSPKVDEQGKEIISKLNENEMRNIAKQANGNYISLQNNTTALLEYTAAITKIEGSKSEESSREYIHYFPIFILLAMAFLLASMYYSKINKTV